MQDNQTGRDPHPGQAIRQELQRVQTRIAEAALRAERNPSEVMLVAVSKTVPATAILEAAAAGQRDFGENRVEEALPKMNELTRMTRFVPAAQGIHWHLMGHLQSRKVRDAAGHFDIIHSVDTPKLAVAINSRVASLEPPAPDPQTILLECNVSGEASKTGFPVAAWQHDNGVLNTFLDEVERVLALPHLRVRGLMTIAPIVEHPDQARPYFASLRALREVLRQRFPNGAWDHLSMGMTDDYEVAIAEGSTIVRIGRAIFGERTSTLYHD